MTVALNMLRAARRLRDEGGFAERQAAILVDTFAEGMGETLATKAAPKETETMLRANLEKTEATSRSEFRELEQRMTIRLGAMMVGAVALIVAPIELVQPSCSWSALNDSPCCGRLRPLASGGGADSYNADFPGTALAATGASAVAPSAMTAS